MEKFKYYKQKYKKKLELAIEEKEEVKKQKEELIVRGKISNPSKKLSK